MKPVGTVPITMPGKKEAIILVYEGVLASVAWREEHRSGGDYGAWCMLAKYDAPNPDLHGILNEIGIRRDVKVIVMTELPTSYKDSVEGWLRRNEIAFDAVHCRYVGNIQETDVQRNGSYKTHIRHQYEVGLVLESIPSCYEMWRAEGLPVILIPDADLEPDGLPSPEDVLAAIASEPTETCPERIGHTNAFCNKTKGHGGECGWSSARNKATTPMLPPAPAETTPAPQNTPTAGDVLPDIETICGNMSGDLRCIRMAKHVGSCHFTKADTPSWEWESDYAGYFGCM